MELVVRDGQMGLLHHAAIEGMEQCLSYLLGFMAKRKITTGENLYSHIILALDIETQRVESGDPRGSVGARGYSL